ncbi:MAG: ABC transporter permease [Gemmatimonadales bacterium]|nr:ABC transporter permease [Gemmatimonadales bacterium]NIN50700.1 ABC transporter permease [Gemmatimonadales bacterium]NIP08164.1 ABC transporter permease [Gemmatimonadales bacterium]NIR01042.1 ABC transporter permease [Gemmatimonadales bacterium]NIS65121.1 ABC transporter permease [Gemmatimonadales bacterium]
MSLPRLWAVARKEIVQLRRDARSLYLAFILPLILLVLFAYAITYDIRNIEMAVLDHSLTSESRSLVDAFESSGYFTVVTHLTRYDEADAVLGGGHARLVLVIGPSFALDLAARRRTPVQLLLDGADANSATIAQNYAEAIVAGYSADILLEGRQLQIPAAAESRVWFNETLESRNMIVPGLVAVIMSIIAAMLTALTIAREWERGTMEQLAATPVHRLEVVLGKLVPYAGIGLFDVALAATVAVVLFGVPLRGNLLLLVLLTLLFLIGALGLGIFISAAVKSQLLATQVALMSTFLPALLLSGFIFSIATMPFVLRAISYIVPARYYVTVTRGIFLKGVGVDVLWADATAMVIFAAAGLSLAMGVFKKEIA